MNTGMPVESPVRGDSHAGFGGRLAETERPKGRHRAAGRPYLAGDAVDKVRLQEWQAKGPSVTPGGLWIKHTRWALLKAPEKLTDRQRLALAEIQRINARLYRAYLLKEQLRALYQLKDPGLAPAHLDAWIAWARRSKLKPFVRLARTIRRYREGILAAIRLGLTNERTSYCTSWWGCGGDALVGGARVMMTVGGDGLAGGVLVAPAAVGGPGLAGVVEVGASAVDPSAGDMPSALPDLDCLGGHSELLGDLVECHHARGSESLVVGGDAVVAA